MKIDFAIPTDGQYHELCLNCHAESVKVVKEAGRTNYRCEKCGQTLPRLLVLDPKIISWIDPTTKEYWHESVGIFLFNENNQVLFFQRTKFPFVLTVPAGHLDTGEDPLAAVSRELEEETGISQAKLSFFVNEDIANDQCRRGADSHRWHLYVGRVDGPVDVKVGGEGAAPIWLTLAEAAEKDLPVPVRHFIETYSNKLAEATQNL